MAARETEIINHLLEVERQSSQLLDEAAQEAEKTVSSAMAQADSIFNSRYTEFSSNLEKKYLKDTEELEKECEKQLADYRQNIASVKRDVPAFNDCLEKLLFAGQET